MGRSREAPACYSVLVTRGCQQAASLHELGWPHARTGSPTQGLSHSCVWLRASTDLLSKLACKPICLRRECIGPLHLFHVTGASNSLSKPSVIELGHAGSATKASSPTQSTSNLVVVCASAAGRTQLSHRPTATCLLVKKTMICGAYDGNDRAIFTLTKLAAQTGSTQRSPQRLSPFGAAAATHRSQPPVRRSGSAVKFAELPPVPEEPSSSSSGSVIMRYGRILTGGRQAAAHSEESAEMTKKVFNPAAAPAKPAMKPVRPTSGSGSLYPEVDDEGNPIIRSGSGSGPNPATGLVGYQTRGGAAFSSALGVQDCAVIPPPCPPALPNIASSRGAASTESGTAAAAAMPGPVSNPLAVPDMPHMGPLAAASRPGATAAGDMADGTVQLSTAGYSFSKSRSADVTARDDSSRLQRDQQPKAADWEKHGAPAGTWHLMATAGDAGCKDIEAADSDGGPPSIGKGAADHEDDDSRWALS